MHYGERQSGERIKSLMMRNDKLMALLHDSVRRVNFTKDPQVCKQNFWPLHSLLCVDTVKHREEQPRIFKEPAGRNLSF